MDTRHIERLFKIARITRPRTVIEIGSYQGASTTAWIVALNEGFVQTVRLYEIAPTAELHAMIAKANDQRAVSLNTRPYYDAPEYADLILIDGAHGWQALADLASALAMGCPQIIMHDSRTYMNLGDGWGAWLGANILKSSPLYRWFEDAEKRSGEWTHRGLLYASKHAKAQEAWKA